MAAGEGMGAGRTSGRGRGRGRGGRGGRKKGRGASKQGTMISGPPRLENVAEDKLDTVYVFREERPGRYVDGDVFNVLLFPFCWPYELRVRVDVRTTHSELMIIYT